MITRSRPGGRLLRYVDAFGIVPSTIARIVMKSLSPLNRRRTVASS